MFRKYVAAAFIAIPSVLAGPVAARDESASSYSQIVCVTAYGLKSVRSVPTSTKAAAVTLTEFRKSTSIPTLTVTPEPVTSTVVEDETTTVIIEAPQETDTFTTTLVEATTVDVNEYVQITETGIEDVTITTQVTTTVPTSAGFTAVQSVNGNPAAKRALPTGAAARAAVAAAIREVPEDLEARSTKDSFAKISIDEDGNCVQTPKQYPQSVYCEEFLEVIKTITKIVTVRSTVTSTAEPSTATETTTNTITETTVSEPVDASTTITEMTTQTFSMTNTITEVAYATVTNTETLAAAETATAYAACDASNFINSRGGHQITRITQANSGVTFTYKILETADKEAGTCDLMIQNVCTAGQVIFTYDAPDSAPVTDAGAYIGNGNCGLFKWDQVTEA
ncbi:hypothetical protein MGN70_014595 [Eutypa lata]|nr:hypothetical protein MGN70_014595 [Eutypa lata]